MADGCLERQIRRLRKLYYGKKGMLVDAVKGILGNHVEIEGTKIPANEIEAAVRRLRDAWFG